MKCRITGDAESTGAGAGPTAFSALQPNKPSPATRKAGRGRGMRTICLLDVFDGNRVTPRVATSLSACSANVRVRRSKYLWRASCDAGHLTVVMNRSAWQGAALIRLQCPPG